MVPNTRLPSAAKCGLLRAVIRLTFKRQSYTFFGKQGKLDYTATTKLGIGCALVDNGEKGKQIFPTLAAPGSSATKYSVLVTCRTGTRCVKSPRNTSRDSCKIAVFALCPLRSASKQPGDTVRRTLHVFQYSSYKYSISTNEYPNIRYIRFTTNYQGRSIGGSPQSPETQPPAKFSIYSNCGVT